VEFILKRCVPVRCLLSGLSLRLAVWSTAYNRRIYPEDSGRASSRYRLVDHTPYLLEAQWRPLERLSFRSTSHCLPEYREVPAR